MASNCLEWTTETTNNVEHPCVTRGDYYNGNTYTAVRTHYGADNGYIGNSFRPILYL